MKEFILGLNELDPVYEEIRSVLGEGGVIILQGDLAAGKTTLTQGFAKFLGEDEVVTSPTFSLQQCYGERLYHYDLYNKGVDHFLSLGLLEELEKEGYHLIEWGEERLESLLKSAGIDVMRIEIEKLEDKRVYRCIS